MNHHHTTLCAVEHGIQGFMHVRQIPSTKLHLQPQTRSSELLLQFLFKKKEVI